MTEQDFRVTLLNNLLTTPHGDLVRSRDIHLDILMSDPIFYAHLAVWYKLNGSVRDHNIIFPALLATSRVDDMLEVHRKVGRHLVELLPPYQVARTVRFIKEGMERNIPRSLKTTIENYLGVLESTEARFDGAVLSGRDDLKYLYSTLHISAGDRAQAVLFDDNPPEGSKPWAIKQASKEDGVYERAKYIVEYDLPWTIATSLISPSNPIGLAALVMTMTPGQVINNLSSIKKVGGMDNPEIRNVVNMKLKEAKTDKRVSAYKTKVAADASQVDDEAVQLLEEVREKQVKSKGRITMDTAIFVDISGSMEVAIDVAKQLAPMIANICEGHLHVIAFNTMPYAVPVPSEMSLAGMEKAMAGLRAGGMTSCGAPVAFMLSQNINVEQIVMITDEGENTSPSFYSEMSKYNNKFGKLPSVTIVRVGPHTENVIQRSCVHLGAEYNAFDFNGDYYSLPNVIPFLTGKSRLDLVMEIMATELPV